MESKAAESPAAEVDVTEITGIPAVIAVVVFSGEDQTTSLSSNSNSSSSCLGVGGLNEVVR